MSKRGIDAPLAEQMDRLKRTMHNRDMRRDQDREKRMVSKTIDDPYAQANLPRPATGGVSLGPGAAAQAAVLNAAAIEGPSILRCDLCQADFRNEAVLRQHMEGPAHKKALAKEKAQKERESWMGNPSAAANALQAAAWLSGGEMKQREPNYKPPQRDVPTGRGQGRGRGRGFAEFKPPPPVAAKPQGPSHAQLIAQARKVNEPISINGWIPPSLDIPAATSLQKPEFKEESLSPGFEGLVAIKKEEEADGAIKKEKLDANVENVIVKEELGEHAEPEGAGFGVGLEAYGNSSGSEDDKESGDSEIDAPQKQKFESFF